MVVKDGRKLRELRGRAIERETQKCRSKRRSTFLWDQNTCLFYGWNVSTLSDRSSGTFTIFNVGTESWIENTVFSLILSTCLETKLNFLPLKGIFHGDVFHQICIVLFPSKSATTEVSFLKMTTAIPLCHWFRNQAQNWKRYKKI